MININTSINHPAPFTFKDLSKRLKLKLAKLFPCLFPNPQCIAQPAVKKVELSSPSESASAFIPVIKQKRILHVTHLPRTAENIELTRKVTKLWKDIALAKYSQAKIQEEKIKFSDASGISCSINYNCHNREIFMCIDSKQETQAIALTEEQIDYKGIPYLYVSYLVTNPKNIRSEVNANESSRVEGAGTALISHLAKVCLQTNKASIRLTALSSAIPFYKKLGFEYDCGTLVLKVKQI